MYRHEDAIRIGRQVLAAEAAAVAALADRVSEEFSTAVRMILDTPGRVVLTGMGKSGAIARKLAGTFSSTGTPAFFLHPAEAVHGDLGAVTADDLVIALSYSGETAELTAILTGLKRIPVRIISLVRRGDSTLAKASDVILDITVDREACPLGLAPTASTTAALAMGDALAMSTMHLRAFTPEQFARNHPAGSLGRKLLTIDEVMRVGEGICTVGPDSLLLEALAGMGRSRLGAALVVDGDRSLLGIITEGDIRRKIQDAGDIRYLRSGDMMITHPRVIQSGRLASEALAIMQSPPRPVNVLPVIDAEGKLLGATHVQDLVQIGLG